MTLSTLLQAYLPSSFSKLLVLLAISSIAYLTVSTYVAWRKLRDFKGPFWAGLTNVWLAWTISLRQTHLAYADVCKKYGECGPNVYFLREGKNVQANVYCNDCRTHCSHRTERSDYFVARAGDAYGCRSLALYAGRLVWHVHHAARPRQHFLDEERAASQA